MMTTGFLFIGGPADGQWHKVECDMNGRPVADWTIASYVPPDPDAVKNRPDPLEMTSVRLDQYRAKYFHGNCGEVNVVFVHADFKKDIFGRLINNYRPEKK